LPGLSFMDFNLLTLIDKELNLNCYKVIKLRFTSFNVGDDDYNNA
jgi:hypothetical protein